MNLQTKNQNSNGLFSFLTGSAGSGKSYIMIGKMKKDSSFIELGATTGIAAINCGTKTINSILKYFDTNSLRENYESGKLQYLLRKIRQTKKNLGIEEVSMLHAEQLDLIYDAIVEINEDKVTRRLGLILVGDLCQLSPVKGEFITKSKCWPEFKSNMTKLTKIWRQSDSRFLNALNCIRKGHGEEAIEYLKMCNVEFRNTLINDFKGTTIIPKNVDVDNFNTKRLYDIPNQMIRVVPTRKGSQLGEWKLIPTELRLKIGAYVMILQNEIETWSYVNGDCGEIVGYDQTKDMFGVRLKRTNQVVCIRRMKRFNLSDENPKPYHFNGGFRPYNDHRTGKWVMGEISYHPLRLAYASTTHKCQGLSLDLVQLDSRPQFFGLEGMCYVGISRARTPEGLIIVGNENDLARKIKVNKEVLEYV